MSKLNLCGKMSNLAKKAMCPTVDAMIGVASGMAGSAAADALMPNNCFVAGTPVWVLRDGVDAKAANAALAEGASWEDFAEQKPIEEVEAGDYALSRPEDDADGQLRFMPVTETYTNTTEEVVELWVVNYATGEHDHLLLTQTPGAPNAPGVAFH